MKNEITFKELLIQEVLRLREIVKGKDAEIRSLKDELLKHTDPTAYELKKGMNSMRIHLAQDLYGYGMPLAEIPKT